ncbi:uncharacterized protein VP01_4612g1, partial [Puccinia sorghi]
NSTSAPAPNPNLMDLSAFQKALSNRLSDAKRTHWVQLNLCFCCIQPSSSARLSELQEAEMNFGGHASTPTLN